MQIKLHRPWRVALDGRNNQFTFQPGVYSVPDEMAQEWADGALSRGPAYAEEIKPTPKLETKAPSVSETKPAPKRRGRPRKSQGKAE